MLVLTCLCFSKSLLIIHKIYDSYLEDSTKHMFVRIPSSTKTIYYAHKKSYLIVSSV